jgi:tetratricopeptide (TPR) repeat protein
LKRIAVVIFLCGWFSTASPDPRSPLGRISFPTSGSPAAQPQFIRGVLLLHSFEYDDAIDAFREAERLDPGFAMAYWGEAMCFNQPLWEHEELDKARAALARLGPSAATRAKKAPTPRERGYLDAIERLFGDGDKATRDRAYADRMAALVREFPGDDEAGAFYALALLGTIPPESRDTTVALRAGGIASAILKRNPEHPGAAHYALHAYDAGEQAARGLVAARIYAKLAPASSHARHMPSHAFLPLGLWDEATASDESAWAASIESVRRKGAPLALADFHSLTWLHYEYLQQGRFTKARELLDPINRALAEQAAHPVTGAPDHGHVESEIGRGYGTLSLKNEAASMRARLVVESGEWATMRGQATFDNVDELFALGMSSAKLGDTARAEAAVEHMGRARDAATDADNRDLARIMELELMGLVEIARGQPARALLPLAEAARLEANERRPVARPYPIKPAAELYAEALAGAGDPLAAIDQFKAALARTPNRAAALMGLARALRAAEQPAAEARAAKSFLGIWRRADSNRPELAEASRLAGGA